VNFYTVRFPRKSAWGQGRRFEAIGDDSGLPPTPDISLRRSEPTLCAK
jgi:hypothetical protein